ncbi:MAG: regulatory protein RecX [Acidaminococcaceae bacterium]|nr:regulatory protein RecX [Acidaminococcaceae bacterium]
MFRNASRSLTTSEEVYEYAMTLLDRREHGEKELVQKLKRRCTSALLIREAVEKLKQYDLINEKRYAIRVFEAWRGKKVYGRLHLQAELLKKQVDEQFIPEILDSFSEEEEGRRLEAAYQQIARRRDKKYDVSTEKGVAALVRYFSAKGFGPSLIRRGIERAKEDREQ